MKAMKRTILVGSSMFALVFGVSAQADDVQAFEAYKTSWKMSHKVMEMTPAQYEQMKSDWTQSLIVEPKARMTRAESEAQEAAMKNANKETTSVFPEKRNTGNPEADEAAYKAAKDLWIRNNPELYKQMSTAPKMTPEQEAIRRQVRNNQIK